MSVYALTEKQKKWSEHIERAKKKGLSFAKYCKEEKLNASHMHYYAGKLRRKTQKREPKPAFIEIKPSPVPSPSPSIVIRIGTQVSMEIPADLSFLTSLLRWLG